MFSCSPCLRLTGIQRFSISAGLAVPVSELEAGVANSMGWASGDFGLFMPSSTACDRADDCNSRRLNEDTAELITKDADALAPFFERLMTLSITVGVVAALQLGLVLCWSRCANRRFYAARARRADSMRRASTRRRGLMDAENEDVESESDLYHASDRFRPFPGVAVFPCLLLVACKLFVTGLVANAVDLVLTPSSLKGIESKQIWCAASALAAAASMCAYARGARYPCHPATFWPTRDMRLTVHSNGWCRISAIATLIAITGYNLLGWYVTVHFLRRYRASQWKGAAKPADVDGVKDPLFRLLSRLRSRWLPDTRCCRHAVPRVVSDRGQGKFAKPASSLVEPERTERLLAWSELCALRKTNAADVMDAYQFAFFPRSNGATSIAIFFDHYGLTCQMLIAVLSGSGNHIEPGSSLATFQVVATLLLQLSHAAFCLYVYPSMDKLDSVVVGSQVLAPPRAEQPPGAARATRRACYPHA